MVINLAFPGSTLGTYYLDGVCCWSSSLLFFRILQFFSFRKNQFFSIPIRWFGINPENKTVTCSRLYFYVLVSLNQLSYNFFLTIEINLAKAKKIKSNTNTFVVVFCNVNTRSLNTETPNVRTRRAISQMTVNSLIGGWELIMLQAT